MDNNQTTRNPSNAELFVFIVDDDDAVRDALEELMDSVALRALGFPSAQSFLKAYAPGQGGCLVLDIRMPGMGGLELQAELSRRNILLPIIFITGHGDVPMAVEAMQKGAFDFLQKPFRDQDLLDRIKRALSHYTEQRRTEQERCTILERLQRLTAREREVMEQVVEGKANKVIAFELNISQRTVEIHRARVMDKMGAASLADLISMAMQSR